MARSAESFVGVPFRLHGRDPATGLDCVGLVAASLQAIGRPCPVPQTYSIRSLDFGEYLPFAERAGLAPCAAKPLPGDVLLAKVGPAQIHLLIVHWGDLAVHAHAGLRKVVITPLTPDWPVLRQWRLRQEY